MRTPRRQCESEMYHIICRGAGRQLIFEDDEDRERFLDLLRQSTRLFAVEVVAWCLMGNHVHLLFHAPLGAISQCMKRVYGGYAQQFNLRHARSGHLFQERFKSEPIEDGSYLLTVVKYIHYNPEKAGIAKHDEYLWSSYAEYATCNRPCAICSIDFVRDLLGGTGSFIAFHETYSDGVPCMDVDGSRSSTRAMPDEIALEVARKILDGRNLGEIKSLERQERNRLLALLLANGLSIRQTERLTGVGRGVIQAIKVKQRKS